MLGPWSLRVELDLIDLHIESRDAAGECLGGPPGKHLADVVGDRSAGRAHFGTRPGSAGEQVAGAFGPKLAPPGHQHHAHVRRVDSSHGQGLTAANPKQACESLTVKHFARSKTAGGWLW
jgi:hypothetical protein